MELNIKEEIKDFIPLISFYINETMELKSINESEIEDKVIVEILEQWIKHKKTTDNTNYENEK